MELAFKVLVIFTIIQRLGELFLAKSNEKYITSLGGKVLPEKNYIFMVLLHTSWLLSLIYFAFFRDLTFSTMLFYTFLILFIIGQVFRILAIKTLGRRWSTRVMVLPDVPAVESGLFSYIRHPNYLGVILEIVALPMIAGLWPLAAIFSVLNGVILFFRIRFEEKMLIEHCHYEKMTNR